MSVPFAVATALALTQERAWPPVLTLDDFERSLADEGMRDPSRRTSCVYDGDIDRATTTEYVPARVTVQLADGKSITHSVPLPLGSPEHPLTAEEISTRFRSVVGPL